MAARGTSHFFSFTSGPDFTSSDLWIFVLDGPAAGFLFLLFLFGWATARSAPLRGLVQPNKQEKESKFLSLDSSLPFLYVLPQSKYNKYKWENI